MAEYKTLKKGKGRSKGQEGRLIFRIRRELIEQLEELADGEELSLSAYIRQFLKHEVVAKNTRDREFEQFRAGQRGLQVPIIRGLPTNTGELVASPNLKALPDPFLYPNTDFARALIKRAIRQQALPRAWGYGRLTFLDREGLSHCRLNSPHFIDPLARESDVRMKPFWKVLPGEYSNGVMSKVREALQGNPSDYFFSLEHEGRQLNFKMKVFDQGKGLAACLLKNWWENDRQSVKAPSKFDELSRYYLRQKRLELSGPQVVWWVQDTGLIANHRSQLIGTPLNAFSRHRLAHVAAFFDTDLVEDIMSRVHTAFQTQEKQLFTLKETLGNLWKVNSYTIYPLNNVRANERDVVMMTKHCLVSTILDPQKIYSVEWGEGVVNR